MEMALMVQVLPLVLFRGPAEKEELDLLLEQVVLRFQGRELAVEEVMEAELLELGAPMVH
jgi:hypothetical protein